MKQNKKPGNQVQIGVDHWPGSGITHLLPNDLIERLHTHDIHFVSQVSNPTSSSLWQQGWLRPEALGLTGNLSLTWINYISALQSGHIMISEREDELVWQKVPHGVYTPKMGYVSLFIDLMQREPCWWWRGLQKHKFPLKTKIFMWCFIYNKIPTWENMRKHCIVGPGWCPLCKGDNDSNSHLLIFCFFSRQVWLELSILLNHMVVWDGLDIELAWQSWIQTRAYKSIKALPLIVCRGIWLACNKTIFQDSPSLPKLVAARVSQSSLTSLKKKSFQSSTSFTLSLLTTPCLGLISMVPPIMKTNFVVGVQYFFYRLIIPSNLKWD